MILIWSNEEQAKTQFFTLRPEYVPFECEEKSKKQSSNVQLRMVQPLNTDLVKLQPKKLRSAISSPINCSPGILRSMTTSKCERSSVSREAETGLLGAFPGWNTVPSYRGALFGCNNIQGKRTPNHRIRTRGGRTHISEEAGQASLNIYLRSPCKTVAAQWGFAYHDAWQRASHAGMIFRPRR